MIALDTNPNDMHPVFDQIYRDEHTCIAGTDVGATLQLQDSESIHVTCSFALLLHCQGNSIRLRFSAGEI